jgi:hypothetical protein
MELLQENPQKINWSYLCMNANAIELLKKNPEKINYSYLNINTSIDAIKLKKIIDSYTSANKDIFILKNREEDIKKTLEIILS